MIYRYYQNGTKLEVAGLNQITVLIDRSETELTEVALNSWPPGLDGPPHFHEQKEQIFYLVSGQGTVKIGNESFGAKPGDLFYVPAGVVHQTINRSQEPLVYFLFNAFADSGKEGHVSFADHIEKVKATRQLQAQTQDSGAAVTPQAGGSQRKGKCVAGILPRLGEASARGPVLPVLSAEEASRCEASLLSCAANQSGPAQRFTNKERTLFVLNGAGFVCAGAEKQSVKTGDVLFVPRNTPSEVRGNSAPLVCLALDTRLD